MTDINSFLDILQLQIDNLKNKPKETEIIAVIIHKSKDGIQTDIFKHVSDKNKYTFDSELLDTIIDLTKN